MSELNERLNYYLKADVIPDGKVILPNNDKPAPKLPPNLTVVTPESKATPETATTREQQRMRAHIKHLLHNTSMHHKAHHIDVKQIKLGPAEDGDRSLHVHLHSHSLGRGETGGGYHHHYDIHVQEFGKHKAVGKDHSNSELIQSERSMLRSHLTHLLHNTSILSGHHPENITRVRRGTGRRVLHVYTSSPRGKSEPVNRHYIVHIRHHKTGA
jgi:hypothetical protein